MGLAASPAMLILGRALVGLGVGLASVTVPVYIAECAPVALRATLVSVNVLMITTGQFMAYFIDWLCTFLPGTWRCVQGAILQGFHRAACVYMHVCVCECVYVYVPQVDAGFGCAPSHASGSPAGSAARVPSLAHGPWQGCGGTEGAAGLAW